MWLSKNINQSNLSTKAESAKITISNNNLIESSGTTNSRNIKVYAPYGYSAIVPQGKQALVLPSSFGRAVVGIEMDKNDLKDGEIKLCSDSGAYVLLRSDGNVEINGLVIRKDGSFERN